MLKVNEIFYSIQGESSYAGLPCVFIRLTYCNLRCTYCDTEYAFYEGEDLSIDEIISEIKKYKCNIVEVTGGEPLMQKESFELLKRLCDQSFDVLLETSGSISIEEVDKRVKIIMDLKTPSSGMMEKNLLTNLNFLKSSDEIKFVIADRDDYDWSKQIIQKFYLAERCSILMGCVFGNLQPVELANWILQDQLNVRFQLQLHKYIWDPVKRGV
ncbi:MAG: 7-carboxy-7-deazaguanine synthase QueE [Bacteroidetes bacterium]|nr:7-carboxy-7-deazaguanine synthase QueE [Bacteroidota bacterium]MBU2585021.1 7-carboxy-7-deazaguanine synthase QueE [Bacteroidota bacterium]